MGLDWCVQVYESREQWTYDYEITDKEKSHELQDILEELREEIQDESDIDLEYRGKDIAYILEDIETEDDESMSNLCYGEEEYDDEGRKRSYCLSKEQMETLIQAIEFVKENDDYINRIIEKEDKYYVTKEEVIDECECAIVFLQKILDYDGDKFIRLWCWW